MGRTRSTGLAALGLALVCGGCHLAPAKVWNLEQVHQPDGPHRHRGRVKSDIAYLFDDLFRRSNFGGEGFQARQSEEKRIEDPLGTCLENLIELGECRSDEKVAGLQAAAFAWLAVDCPSVLSRERCVLELGLLARRLTRVEAQPGPPAEPASPEVVKERFDALLATVREVRAAPELAGGALAEECARILALELDRAGALRCLRATGALLAGGERGALLAPLRELRLELARRCAALALRAARADGHGRVRAAALEAGVQAFQAERAELLRWALVEDMDGVAERGEVSLRALELLARHGLPPVPEGETPGNFERVWTDLLVQVLRLQVDGPHATAACRALARITGEPLTLRPEVWTARWRAGTGAVREATEASGAGGTGR